MKPRILLEMLASYAQSIKKWKLSLCAAYRRFLMKSSASMARFWRWTFTLVESIILSTNQGLMLCHLLLLARNIHSLSMDVRHIINVVNFQLRSFQLCTLFNWARMKAMTTIWVLRWTECCYFIRVKYLTVWECQRFQIWSEFWSYSVQGSHLIKFKL